jgi:hypothetical protein
MGQAVLAGLDSGRGYFRGGNARRFATILDRVVKSLLAWMGLAEADRFHI